MKINTLETLLQEELKDIYDAEKRLVGALSSRETPFCPAMGALHSLSGVLGVV